MPSPKSKWCPDHENSESPCVLASKLESVEKIKSRTHEETFTVETILEIQSKPDKKYKIKWMNYPLAEATWEPQENIPAFIRKVIILNLITQLLREM